MHKESNNYFKFDARIIRRINQAIETIKSIFGSNIIEICLFGSYCLNRFHQYSSIDILVILRECDMEFIKRKVELERILNEDYLVPLIDPLVYTEAEVLSLLKEKDSFMDSVIQEAVVLYNGFNEIDIEKLSASTVIKSRYLTAAPKLQKLI